MSVHYSEIDKITINGREVIDVQLDLPSLPEEGLKSFKETLRQWDRIESIAKLSGIISPEDLMDALIEGQRLMEKSYGVELQIKDDGGLYESIRRRNSGSGDSFSKEVKTKEAKAARRKKTKAKKRAKAQKRNRA